MSVESAPGTETLGSKLHQILVVNENTADLIYARADQIGFFRSVIKKPHAFVLGEQKPEIRLAHLKAVVAAFNGQTSEPLPKTLSETFQVAVSTLNKVDYVLGSLGRDRIEMYLSQLNRAVAQAQEAGISDQEIVQELEVTTEFRFFVGLSPIRPIPKKETQLIQRISPEK